MCCPLSWTHFPHGVALTTVQIELPEELARRAREAGLLRPEAVEQLIAEALRERRIERLFEVRKQLQAAGVAPMSGKDIEAEIRAAREEARRAAGT
jgi:uncharacterized protein YnzC (UPF0291/DUF896 family)